MIWQPVCQRRNYMKLNFSCLNGSPSAKAVMASSLVNRKVVICCLFLRRLIDLSKTVSKLQHMINMDSEVREDILWWHKFVSTWNGVSIIQTPMVTFDEFTLFTDASGSLGSGAIYRSHWFSSSWPRHLQEYLINFKELFAIVAAVKTWGHNWSNKQILTFTDNKVFSDSWKFRSSKNLAIMLLLGHIFFHAARYNFNVTLQHLPGHDNHLAYLLSVGRWSSDCFMRYLRLSSATSQLLRINMYIDIVFIYYLFVLLCIHSMLVLFSLVY